MLTVSSISLLSSVFCLQAIFRQRWSKFSANVSRLENCGNESTPSQHKYRKNFKLNNRAISDFPDTRHIFKPLLNAVLYFRNLINNTTFKRKVRFQLSIFTQTWFFAQRLVSRNVFSTQSYSAKFGSDFTYHAKIFGKFF